MLSDQQDLRRKIAAAHSEAIRVGDSPLRADRVVEQVKAAVRALSSAGLDTDRSARIAGHLEAAERVLRRDDDGREAARHLQAALAHLEPPPARPSPFDD